MSANPQAVLMQNAIDLWQEALAMNARADMVDDMFGTGMLMQAAIKKLSGEPATRDKPSHHG